MLGSSLKYFLQHPARLTNALAAGPFEAWI